MNQAEWGKLCLNAIEDDAARAWAEAYLAKTREIVGQIEIKDRDGDGKLLDATTFRAELASRVCAIAWFHHLAANGGSLRKIKHVSQKSGRLSEGERRARQMEKIAAWLDPVEKRTSVAQDTFIGLRDSGHLPVHPGGAFVVRPHFVSETIRAAAAAIRDTPPSVRVFGIEQKIDGKGRRLDDPDLDACLFNMRNALRRFVRDPGLLKRPRHVGYMTELAGHALDRDVSMTTEAARKRLARLDAKGLRQDALYTA